MPKNRLHLSLILAIVSISYAAIAAASSEKIPPLPGTLTPSGAEKAANADGTIPAWTGASNPLSKNHSHVSGHAYTNIYRKDQPLFDVHAHNLQRHVAYLSPGLKALFAAYPETFFMPVYPTHREHSYNAQTRQRIAWNAQHTTLSQDGNALISYTGSVPFPIPVTAEQVIWNARLNHPNPILTGSLDDIAVYPNGKRHLSRQAFISEYPFSNPNNPVGLTEQQLGSKLALIMVDVQKPERDKGTKTVIHEAINPSKSERKAWIYNSRIKRVKASPELGYDLPYGPGGFATFDDILGFNGSIDRYHWTLIGKQEKYIPYHAYDFDRQDLDYFELLMEHHANPEYMRYEKHRVWVVEAQLKDDEKHSYSKRRFYIDEDSWQITLLESYDHDGNIWRIGILNTVYDLALQGHVARAQMIHDLKAKAYISMRMVNANGQPRLQGTPKGHTFYSANNLRRLGK